LEDFNPLTEKNKFQASSFKQGVFKVEDKNCFPSPPNPLSQGARGNYLIIEKKLPSPCGRGAGGERFSNFENTLLF
jgi:hypothetical protein